MLGAAAEVVIHLHSTMGTVNIRGRNAVPKQHRIQHDTVSVDTGALCALGACGMRQRGRANPNQRRERAQMLRNRKSGCTFSIKLDSLFTSCVSFWRLASTVSCTGTGEPGGEEGEDSRREGQEMGEELVGQEVELGH